MRDFAEPHPAVCAYEKNPVSRGIVTRVKQGTNLIPRQNPQDPFPGGFQHSDAEGEGLDQSALYSEAKCDFRTRLTNPCFNSCESRDLAFL